MSKLKISVFFINDEWHRIVVDTVMASTCVLSLYMIKSNEFFINFACFETNLLTILFILENI